MRQSFCGIGNSIQWYRIILEHCIGCNLWMWISNVTNGWLALKGQEYTTKYRLEYQREDDGRWFRYKNHNGSEVSSVFSTCRAHSLLIWHTIMKVMMHVANIQNGNLKDGSIGSSDIDSPISVHLCSKHPGLIVCRKALISAAALFFTGPYNYQTAPRPPIKCRPHLLSQWILEYSPEISLHRSPNCYRRVKKCDFWPYRSTSLNFEPLSFRNVVDVVVAVVPFFVLGV